jgi:hypothetical protein
MREDRVPEWAKPMAKDDELLTMDWAETVEARLSMLENRLPNTRLLDKRLLPRAFAVVGHEILGYLVLLSPIYGILLILIILESFGIFAMR